MCIESGPKVWNVLININYWSWKYQKSKLIVFTDFVTPELNDENDLDNEHTYVPQLIYIIGL